MLEGTGGGALMKWVYDIHPVLIIPETPAKSASSYQLKTEGSQGFWLLDQGPNENHLSVPLLIHSGTNNRIYVSSQQRSPGYTAYFKTIMPDLWGFQIANSLYMQFLLMRLKSSSGITKITLHRRCFTAKPLDLLDHYFFLASCFLFLS